MESLSEKRGLIIMATSINCQKYGEDIKSEKDRRRRSFRPSVEPGSPPFLT